MKSLNIGKACLLYEENLSSDTVQAAKNELKELTVNLGMYSLKVVNRLSN